MTRREQAGRRPAQRNEPHKTTNTDRVFIFDTTLRDGEQCPGATMTFEEKLEVADFLDDDGRRHHRGRLPHRHARAISPPSRRSPSALKRVGGVRPVARRRGSTSTAPARPSSTRARPRIHTFIATSPVHRKHKLKKSAEQVLEMVHFQVTRARNWVEDVEWSAEDATRTEIDYLCRCVETAHQGRRHHHQPARYGGLRHARGILPDVPRP